jgi:Fur family ferric uptake transcriptional regulator
MGSELLKKKRLRVTPFRKKVVDIVSSFDRAISVEELENELGEHDRITLYRTLKSFTEKGVIHEIVMPGEQKKIALCDPVCNGGEGHHEHNHIHFQCATCKKVYCIDQIDIPTITIPKFQVDNIEIQVKGICENCTK